MVTKIIEVLSVPIILLNTVGGIIGGVWLAILGEWRLIGVGVLLLFTSPWILSILMMPNLLIAGIAVRFIEKKYILGYVFGFISQLYINILIVATCVFAFTICSNYYEGHISISYVPYLLWSWGMALGPWQYFASKEPENEFSAITLFSASIFYFLILVSHFINMTLGVIIVGVWGLVQLILLPIFNIYIVKLSESKL
jgi:hypothetical protein